MGFIDDCKTEQGNRRIGTKDGITRWLETLDEKARGEAEAALADDGITSAVLATVINRHGGPWVKEGAVSGYRRRARERS